MLTMRTTLTLDEDLIKALKDIAHREGAPFKRIVNRVLRVGLAAGRHRPQRRRPFRTKTFAMGHPLVANLDKSLQLAAALEDEEIARKLSLRK